MKKHLVMAVVPFLALGCGDDFKDENGDGIADGVREPDNVTVVTPATPKGTISGQVLTSDLKPLTEATVEVTIGSSPTPLSATTDAKGNFTFKDVPGGSQVLLTFSKSGYASLRATATIPGEAGNVPLNNANVSFGPVTLTRLDGSLRFLLVTPQGRPAANVRATLEANPAGNITLENNDVNLSIVSTVTVEATSDENGALVFQNIPNAQEMVRYTGSVTSRYRLWVSAVDANGDGVPESNGYVASYTASEVIAQGTTRTLHLLPSRPNTAALAIDGSNVGSLKSATNTEPLRNMVRPGEPIYLYFNQPVQPSSLLARMTDEYAKESLPVTVALGTGGYTATITPGNGVVQVGKEYNLDVRAVSAETGDLYSTVGFFFGGDANSVANVTIAEARYQETVRPPAAQNVDPGETVYINFSAALTPAPDLLSTQLVQVFFNMDLNGDRTVGNAFGEYGFSQGYALKMDEPKIPYVTRTGQPELPVFGISYSGYSTRYSFAYNTPLGAPSAYPSLLPSDVKLVVAFAKQAPLGINGSYQSIWGQPINADLAVNGAAIQAAPSTP
ncbi:carboxypeptidase-like regulatory domain-containing protein [Myxococcus landrumensis]|uniref:Carboxypeptidase regulatory-like domain-containing protein n=1 Tax=Myxococcus landrumensis TaxID=2813577 RepID=A0ABX7MZ31_9BACT|nr:carboxypeptidase-like regulatory domain-containing protein [Myxococcus landrumus]QSQ11473.1 carboxypeptidase regulatory-like domain-containing protein [Myxococcus landrumus]